MITPVKQKTVKDFGGMIQVKSEVMIIRKIEDDDGIIYPIKTKKELYVPESPPCLISPQKWAQQENNNYPKSGGTWFSTKARNYTLYLNQ